MNSTVVNSETLSKVKELNQEIARLKELKYILGHLTPEQSLDLKVKQIELTDLINKL